MVSVTQRVYQVHQPLGGHLSPTRFSIEHFQDGRSVSNLVEMPQLTGLVVDYLTRMQLTGDPIRAFEISISGAMASGWDDRIFEILDKVAGLDDQSIENAFNAVQYDAYARSDWHELPREISVSKDSIDMTRVMVERSVEFFNKNGPVIDVGFTFGDGYTNVVTAGDGDFLTDDTIWDLKVSRGPLTKEQTLQILVYYILACNSSLEKFRNISRIGVFNPFRNTAYAMAISSVDDETLDKVKNEVVGISREKIKQRNISIRDYRYSENVSGCTTEELESDLSGVYRGRFISSMVPKAEKLINIDPGSMTANLILGISELRRSNFISASESFARSKEVATSNGSEDKIGKVLVNQTVAFFIEYCRDSTTILNCDVFEIRHYLSSYPSDQFKEVCDNLMNHEYECRSAESVVNLAKSMTILTICDFFKNGDSVKLKTNLAFLRQYLSHLRERILSRRVTSAQNISLHIGRLNEITHVVNEMMKSSAESSLIIDSEMLKEIVEI